MAARLDEAWVLSVLLVEDDPADARRLTDALAQYEGVTFHVEQAAGVEDGLRILREQTFDVMVPALALDEAASLYAASGDRVFVSRDQGERWQTLAADLPAVRALIAA